MHDFQLDGVIHRSCVELYKRYKDDVNLALDVGSEEVSSEDTMSKVKESGQHRPIIEGDY